MRLVLISDTHERHEVLGTVPDGDVLIHAGDYTFSGARKAKDKFFEWFRSQPHKAKVYVAGNHDFREPTEPLIPKEGDDLFYLYNSGLELDGLKFWGSPYTPRFGSWAFMEDREAIGQHWKKIPNDTDVLITHGPPQGLLDRVNGYGESVGCKELTDRMLQINPKLHVFGHIHGSYGQRKLGDTLFVNASICDEAYTPTHEPIVVDL